MKYSQYNSIIPYRDKYALYNAFEKKMIFLDPELKNILVRETQSGIDNLINIHPDFYNYLLENNFLVKDDINEVEEVKKIVYAIDENKNTFYLTINPTINCNFKCWYCYETHIKQSKMNTDIINRINKLILKIAQEDDIEEFNLAFFGGEPLLYFEKTVIPIINNFVPIMKSFNKQFTIGFTTNGYLINDRFINFFNEKQLKPHFHITLDGYRENHDKVRFATQTKGSYSTIIDNIKKLVENEMFVRVRINFTDENIKDTYKIADDLLIIEKEPAKKHLLIDFHRVWQNTKPDDIEIIVNRNVEMIRKKGFNAKSSKYLNDTVRGSCYADKRNSAVINYNGDVFKCTARDFKTENREGFLTDEGEIVWENNSLERRMKAKFHNQPCLSCRLLPICNGACSQIALENLGKRDFCIHSFDEKEKDNVIKAMVELMVREDETR
ncbi:MAG: radical SAM protein [Candidatus Azobacteroides sp.]|nr:radical SAM protein [Candidatus Azobacteroides sp.]